MLESKGLLVQRGVPSTKPIRPELEKQGGLLPTNRARKGSRSVSVQHHDRSSNGSSSSYPKLQEPGVCQRKPRAFSEASHRKKVPDRPGWGACGPPTSYQTKEFILKGGISITPTMAGGSIEITPRILGEGLTDL